MDMSRMRTPDVHLVAGFLLLRTRKSGHTLKGRASFVQATRPGGLESEAQRCASGFPFKGWLPIKASPSNSAISTWAAPTWVVSLWFPLLPTCHHPKAPSAIRGWGSFCGRRRVVLPALQVGHRRDAHLAAAPVFPWGARLHRPQALECVQLPQ